MAPVRSPKPAATVPAPWMLVALLSALLCSTGLAQTPAPEPSGESQQPAIPGQRPAADPVYTLPTLHASTRVISVPALVRNAKGEPVRGLRAGDFVLKQDGNEQAIRYLSEERDSPLTLVLMVDTSGSQKNFLADEMAASNVFFQNVLTRPDDRAAMVQFDYDVLQLQGLTHSPAALTSSLPFLTRHHRIRADLPGTGRGGTLLYDGVCEVSREILGGATGRRAIVLLTDGNDWRSRRNLQDSLACPQAADVTVFSVLYTSNPAYASPGDPPGTTVLQQYADQTGGLALAVSDKQPLTEVFQQIVDSLRAQYLLGYTQPPDTPGKFHRIELTARKKHLAVQARKGYFVPDDARKAVPVLPPVAKGQAVPLAPLP